MFLSTVRSCICSGWINPVVLIGRVAISGRACPSKQVPGYAGHGMLDPVVF